jgi:hypothetical protein
MSKTWVIDASTPKKDIRLALRSRSSQISIDLNQSVADLLAIFEHVKERKDAGPILQLLANHPSADSDLLDRIVTRAEVMGDSGVLNAVATAPHVNVGLLQRLATSPNRFVREHAMLALIEAELDAASPERFREIHAGHASDSEEDVAVRSVLVHHRSIPNDVMKKLQNDSVEAISCAAHHHRRALSQVRKRIPRTKP